MDFLNLSTTMLFLGKYMEAINGSPAAKQKESGP